MHVTVSELALRYRFSRDAIYAWVRIGLIPDINDAKILQVGNASIEGACIALLSRAKRAELESLVRRVTHCRLETHPGFFDFFVEGCQFNPVESARRLELPGAPRV